MADLQRDLEAKNKALVLKAYQVTVIIQSGFGEHLSHFMVLII